MKEKIGHLPPFGLRMPSDVREWIRQTAEQNDRSQNYEIVRAIRERMEREKEVAEQPAS